MKTDVNVILKTMKNVGTPAPDDLPVELLKTDQIYFWNFWHVFSLLPKRGRFVLRMESSIRVEPPYNVIEYSA